MATKRITVSVPVEVAVQIKRAAGTTRSVSEWVTNAVTRSLEAEDVERRFLEFCDAVKVTAAEEHRAKASFDQITQRKSRRGKTAA
jgi:Arc/MetJ-type ribon-helix-helix transcriptional regulator